MLNIGPFAQGRKRHAHFPGNGQCDRAFSTELLHAKHIFHKGGGAFDRFVGGGQTDGRTDRHFFSWGSGIFVCEIFY
jgi:hypothetical protein